MSETPKVYEMTTKRKGVCSKTRIATMSSERAIELEMAENREKQANKLVRKRTKYLKELTVAVADYIRLLDKTMGSGFALLSQEERGKRIAALSNQLEMANDSARYFGLGIDFMKDKKRKATT